MGVHGAQRSTAQRPQSVVEAMDVDHDRGAGLGCDGHGGDGVRRAGSVHVRWSSPEGDCAVLGGQEKEDENHDHSMQAAPSDVAAPAEQQLQLHEARVRYQASECSKVRS